MKIRLTKFVHACLLIETDTGTVLLDPGQMSYESGLFNLEDVNKLDAIAVTHEHFDHFSPLFVKDILQKFPDIPIVSTPAVASKLEDLGRIADSTPLIEAMPAVHESMEPLSGGNTADNIQVDVMGVLTHPGDSLQVKSSLPIFAMPLAGPWGSAIDGIRLAEKLKPKAIVPIHDWMWNETWRSDMHKRCKEYFAQKGINFLIPIDGQAIELEL